MSAETVINKINEKARSEAEAILSEGRAKADEAKRAVLDEANRKAREITDRSSAQGELTVKSARLQAELDNKIGNLNRRHELLGEVFEQAVKAMEVLDDAAWEELYTRLVIENASAGSVNLAVPPAYASKYTKELLEKWNGLASERLGEKVEFILKTDESVESGLVLQSESFDIDLTYRSVLSEIFEAQKKQISDCLFGVEESV